MAEKEPLIVIKKITIEEAGAHGGAWKVAFADFMTALMTFFLVMWLIATASPVQKKNIADYFSTPSIIEYNFSNYGVELTLEKLFLDLINEPLKFFQEFITPVDKSPNIMDMGLKRVVIAHLAEELGDVADDVNVTKDSVNFEIRDDLLFEPGTATPSAKYVQIMEKVKGITAGLDYADVQVDSILYHQSVADGSPQTAEDVATERADLIIQKIQASLEHETVDVVGRAITEKATEMPRHGRPHGKIRFSISMKKDVKGSPNHELSDGIFGKADGDDTVYNNFVKQLVDKKPKR